MPKRWYCWVLGLCLCAVAVALTAWHASRPEVAFRQAIAALADGDLVVVRDTAERLRQVTGFEPHVHLLRGALLLRTGDAQTAISEFALTQPEGELRAPAFLLTAECLYQLGRLAESENLLKQLATESPENSDAHRWLGAIYFDLGAMDSAVTELEELARLEPNDFAPHRMLAIIYFDFEKDTEAIRHLRRALTCDPPQDIDVEMRHTLSHALTRQRNYTEALTELKQLPPTAANLALAAECHWELGVRDTAEEQLTAAKASNPDEQLVLRIEAKVLTEKKQTDAVLRPLRRLLEIDPHDFRTHYQLAQILRRLGQTEEADAQLERMEESKRLKEDFHKLNIEAIQKPRDADVRDNLAQACRTLGKPELAEMWEQAAEACRQKAEFSRGTAENSRESQ
jgi:tetratricopeptide (TPR) repeat protein